MIKGVAPSRCYFHVMSLTVSLLATLLALNEDATQQGNHLTTIPTTQEIRNNLSSARNSFTEGKAAENSN